MPSLVTKTTTTIIIIIIIITMLMSLPNRDRCKYNKNLMVTRTTTQGDKIYKKTSNTSESFSKGHQVRAKVFYCMYNVIDIQVWEVVGTHGSSHDSKQALHKYRSIDPTIKSMVPDLATRWGRSPRWTHALVKSGCIYVHVNM